MVIKITKHSTCHKLALDHGNHNKDLKYHMHKEGVQVELQTTELEKDLGVYVDPKLTFSTHCEKKVNMANKLLGLIRRSYVYLDNEIVKTLYTSLVRPHLEYDNTVWCPVFKKEGLFVFSIYELFLFIFTHY